MILAIIQARMCSHVMPGKVMAPILGEPMIWRQLERIRRSRTISKLVVATSTAPADDALAGFLLSRGCSVYRGDADDVLGRFAACARGWDPRRVVRLKGDCPLVDPQLIDAAVELSLRTGAAYTSNVDVRTYPAGLEVEVLTPEALAAADRDAVDPADRETVTGYIRRSPTRFPQAHLTSSNDRSHLAWGVDGAGDLAFVREVYRRLYPETHDFGLEEVSELMDMLAEQRAALAAA